MGTIIMIMNKNAFTNFDIARVLGHHWIQRRVTSIEGFRGSGSDQGGGGTEMPNIWWEGGPVGSRKNNCDLAQTGAIFRQEGSGSMSVNSTVAQNVL